DAIIWSDSQTAISCINGTTTGATQALLKSTRRALNRVRRKAGGTTVLLQWCPGHSNVRGSDLADAEAKAAARGKHYPPESIPRALAAYRPPRNPTTVKRKLQAENELLARAHWRASQAGIKYHTRYPRLAPHDFLAHVHGLPRSRATLLFRLITGHVQLRHHLHRVQVVDSPVCTHCQEAPETV
ncbi:hypothetical protein BDV93DRAFT_417996, partial [Ceratobasidium sp. AG-I]